MTPDQCEKVKRCCWRTAITSTFSSVRRQALVNVRGNYNRVKVGSAALMKSGYMLEHLEYLALLRHSYP